MASLLAWIDGLDKLAVERYFLYLYNPTIEGIAATLSNPYVHLVWFLPLAFHIFQSENMEVALGWLCSLGLAVALASFFIDLGKDWAARPRPVAWLGIALEMPAGSWPSAHSGNSYAIATVTFLLSRRMGWFVFVFAIATACSRFFVLKHYPSDILCGMVIGVVVGLAAYPVGRRCARYITTYFAGRPNWLAWIRG